MTRYRKTKTHRGIRDVKRAKRTRARVKDLDQIFEDLSAPGKFANQPIDTDLPGLGQHYCLECARYFTTAGSLNDHVKTKLHKKRLKVLKEAPYTQKEADLAAGLGVDERKPASTSGGGSAMEE
ncbi:Bud site selection protein 20 [Borealophlyctis nickersoniae]|nr:Bud site selection protein 20 [Borealophlyctis nickersoniae]